MAAIDHIRCVINGRIAGVQGWSFGFDLAPVGQSGITPTNLNTLAEQLYSAFKTHMFASSGTKVLSSDYGNQNVVLGVSAYMYPAGQSVAAVVGKSTGAAVTGLGTSQLPPQTAVVASLRTDFNGKSFRGRMYLPLLGSATDGAGRLTNAAAPRIAAGVADYLSAARLLTIAGGTLTPVVMSTTTSTTLLREVRRVIVDNVFDTQRNRRDKILATQTGNLPIVVA